MYFKRLEIFGFKSFAEKTELIFEPGVTAIVGPNGCGKSNIADSMRWVLGEQSTKALRSANMEDVIFNGTDTKDSLNLAEVSLVLSNEERILPIDFDEVMITRRLFRSGESEYLINKAQVRLKDITELLMGTGIGTAAYSLIEQGKMDLILSSKPDERRFVFEEASGITKYKSKKREALRKLEQTEQNLMRVNDIIAEVKRQINSIERQARKAELYKTRFEELKSLEIKLASTEFKKFSDKASKLKAESTSLEEEKSNNETTYHELKTKFESLEEGLIKLEAEIEESERRNLNMKNQQQLNSNTINNNTERIKEYRDNIATLESELKNIDDKLATLKSDLENNKQLLDNVVGERQSKERDVSTGENKLVEVDNQIKDNADTVARYKVELMECATKLANLKNELVKLNTNLQNIKVRHRRLNVEKENSTKEHEEQKLKTDSCSIELNSLKENVNKVTDTVNQAQQRADNLQTTLRELENNINQNNTKLAGYESKLEFLLELQRNHEGFSGGTKALLDALSMGEVDSNGVIGVLSELIEPRKDFELIIELALGNNLEGIVVNTKDDAKRLIQFLKEKNLGLARFFVLELFEDFQYTSLIEADDDIRSVAGFVNSDDRLKNLMLQLLGNCYLIKDIDSALSIRKNVKFITEQKEIVEGGLVVGGLSSISEDTSILTRRSKIKELSESIASLKEENNILLNKKELSKKELEGVISNLKQHQETLKTESEKLMVKENEHANLASIMEKLKDELSLVNLEIDEIAQEEETLKEKENSNNEQIKEIEERQKTLESEISNSQLLIDQALKEKENILLKLTQDKTLSSTLVDRERNLRDSFEKVDLDVKELILSKESKTRTLSDHKDKILTLEKEIEELKSQDTHLLQSVTKLSEDLSVKASSRDGMFLQKKQFTENLSIKQSELDISNKRLQGIELELTQLNLKCENITNRMRELYKTELALDSVDENFNPDDAVPQIEHLKGKLEGMGSVNLVAIDEHEELKQRYEFLESQNQDLTSAKDSLLKAIATINKTTKELFMETFQKIQVEFRNFIRLLFGGGSAELLLVDTQDVLESGIEIVARPPGKRLQNISLLSGGEKALTAIALLFAIFKVKPSPFCVLDEIDAPLDESNVDRFSKVLQDFVKMSQFIIITHNKKTITMADVMYGITMQESGVSKIVSVKLGDSKSKEKEPLKEPVN